MPWYLYRVLLPKTARENCPIIEMYHGCNERVTLDPNSGHPMERVYTAPNLSKGYSESHTKKLLSNANLARKGFTKYIRDKSSGCYVKSVGQQGPNVFKVK
ncbi:MAG: hypothetical protein LBH52_03100 [Puniceicoccales bacterium]|nr:hypothetical protein [Puniceicoccales bacterium]